TKLHGPHYFFLTVGTLHRTPFPSFSKQLHHLSYI
ncbi:hypothetical protein QQP08_022136, partial [Theobroma cacao]